MHEDLRENQANVDLSPVNSLTQIYFTHSDTECANHIFSSASLPTYNNIIMGGVKHAGVTEVFVKVQMFLNYAWMAAEEEVVTNVLDDVLSHTVIWLLSL